MDLCLNSVRLKTPNINEIFFPLLYILISPPLYPHFPLLYILSFPSSISLFPSPLYTHFPLLSILISPSTVSSFSPYIYPHFPQTCLHTRLESKGWSQQLSAANKIYKTIVLMEDLRWGYFALLD